MKNKKINDGLWVKESKEKCQDKTKEQKYILQIAKQILNEHKFAFEVLGQ